MLQTLETFWLQQDKNSQEFIRSPPAYEEQD
jgi:hypothetical protein